MDIMRTYLWLFLSLAVIEGLPVQDSVPSESLELPEKEKSFPLGDLLPDQGHVVQQDLKPIVREVSSVQDQPTRSNLVQDYGPLNENSLEPQPLGEQEEIDAYKTLMQIESVSESYLGEEVSEDKSDKSMYGNPTYYKRQLCKGIIIKDKCYQFFRGPLRGYHAELYCQQNFPKGHLASVTSRYIHDQMMLLMDKNGGRTRTWIGGLRYLNTGRFIWLDGALWSYADWLPGEPNNTAGVEDCLELLSNSKFNDMPCWDLRAYICSYPLT